MKIDYVKLNENLEEPFNETNFNSAFLITFLITSAVLIIVFNIFIGFNIFLATSVLVNILIPIFLGMIVSFAGLITFSDCFYGNDYNTECNRNIMKEYNVEDINSFKKNIDFIYNKIEFSAEISDKAQFVNNVLNIIYNDYISNNSFENEIATELNNTGI
jgi:hypothetical protein